MSDTVITLTPKINVRISEDGLYAAVSLEPGDDNATVSAEHILDALKKMEVVINEPIRASAQKLAEAYNIRKKLPGEIILVQGRPSADAVHESVKWSERLEAALVDWQAGAPEDSYAEEAILVVPASEIIGTVLPPHPAVDGISVRGMRLMGKGFAKPLALDETLTRDESTNPASLTSTKTGRIVLEGNQLRVEDVMQVEKSVGPATGNIDSEAHVFVCGSIPDTYEVITTKSVVVGGSIEAAQVRAGTDVLVRLGIVGRGRGSVAAGGEIVAKFCSQIDLCLGGDLKIAAQLMGCNLLAEGKLVAEEASLVGGMAWFRHGGAIDTLGSDACIPTRVIIGEDPDIIKAQAAEEARRRLDGETTDEMCMTGNKCETGSDDSVLSEDEQPLGLLVNTIIYPKSRVSIGLRVYTFEKELKGPVLLTTAKVRNATELVAIHQKTEHVQKLRSQTLSVAELAKEFAPLSKIRMDLNSQPSEDPDQLADEV